MLSRGGAGSAGVADSLLREDAERSLAAMLAEIEPHARGMLDAGEYTGALTSLAGLRDGVDAFFDTVKVMDEDEKLRGKPARAARPDRRPVHGDGGHLAAATGERMSPPAPSPARPDDARMRPAGRAA